MKQFLCEDFLLHSDIARRLYHDYAADMPIYDYHCHLNPREIAENRRFDNLGQIWLEGDHYKWRGMRSAGIPEQLITGRDSSDYEKYQAWAKTVPMTLGNPLYHWTHLELRRPFGITGKVFGPETAQSIWDEANEKLAQPEFSARGIWSAQQMTRQIRWNTTGRLRRMTALILKCVRAGVRIVLLKLNWTASRTISRSSDRVLMWISVVSATC